MKARVFNRLLALGLCASGCVPSSPPVVTPHPLPAISRTANVSIVDSAGNPVDASGSLQADTVTGDVLTASGRGRLSFVVPVAIPACQGAWLTVTADGYQEQHLRVLIPRTDDEFDWGDGCPDAGPVDTVVRLQPDSPPLKRLSMDGRRGFVRDGVLFPATSVTGFRLVELVARGRSADASAFLEATQSARFVRVLLMAFHLFRLTPTEGLAALPATLDLLAAHGRYAEVVLFADTGSYSNLDYRQTAGIAADICVTHPACASIEIGNELAPVHATQDDRLGDVAFLKELRAIIRARGDIPVSLGSTHAEDDESDIFRDGDYLTIHGSRAGGDDAVGIPWRSLRHTNEQRALADRLGKWTWNDEPDRSILRCDWQLGMALLTRLFNLGDTYHFAAGLQVAVPSADEAAALACRARGWALIPDDWVGVYSNASFVGSPVKSAVGAVRVYSSIRGNEAYTLVLGASSPSMVPDWNPGWTGHMQIVNEGGVQLWKETRQ